MSGSATIQPVSAKPEASGSHSLFGFWVYLMTDCILFASLFATFAVIRGNTFGGPAADEIFSLPFVLTETLILLVSSFSCGLAVLAVRHRHLTRALWLLAATLLLGVAFITLELAEFRSLAEEGNSWRRSGFLTAFFTLVGTHGLHVTIGVIWLLSLIISLWRRGIGKITLRRAVIFSLFWHFLDIVWIFIFTIVYLIGIINP